MSMPSDMNADITEAVPAMDRGLAPGERLITQFTPQQRGFAAAALIAFLGVAYLGPALARAMQPKSKARQMEDKARFQAGAMRSRASAATSKARKTAAKAQKKVKRLGGGTI